MKKILLIGETCIDKYVYVNTERLSPEGPILIGKIICSETKPGMAGNVYENLKSLNKDVVIDTIFFPTGTKTRYVDKESGYQLLRIDDDKPSPLNNKNIEIKSDYDLIILSDYGKGNITDNIIEQVSNNNLFVDTKRVDLRIFKDATIKINSLEYSRLMHHHKGFLIVTKGKLGCDLYKGGNQKNYYPGIPVEVKDVVGAGDTFLATLSLYSLYNTLNDAIKIANVAAGIVINKSGTSTVSSEELRKKLGRDFETLESRRVTRPRGEEDGNDKT